MNKKVIVFLLVLVGLGGFVWWKNSAPESVQDRLAKAMSIMQGLESRAIPVALTGDQIKLLEQVYQDSLERIPSIQAFRDADRVKLINALQAAGLTGTGANGLNNSAEALLSLTAEKTDVFASKISAYMTNLGTTVSGTVADNIRKLAQSINTLTNDIRITKLYVAWYENIRSKICTTNDPNNDIYISGEVKMVYTPNTSLVDSCGGSNEVKQFKCINGLYEDDAAHVSTTQCPNGCSGSVCLRENTSNLDISLPSIGQVGLPVSMTVKMLNANTQNANNSVFFIIVEGDDEAEFPTGALRIMSGETTMSGEMSRKFEIKFSKPGKMTVIVRPREGTEISRTIEIVPSTGLLLTDLEARKFTSWKLINPSDPNGADKYLLGAEVCVNGQVSVNDVKKNNPDIKGIPYKYTIYDKTTNAATSFESEMAGGIEDIKNGECNKIAINIQPADKVAFDKAGQVVFELDPKNIIAESEENNNKESMLIIQPVPEFQRVSCASITGASISGCGDCMRINFGSSYVAESVFTPRSNIPAGNKEFVLINEATIVAQTHQSTQIAPTGNIKGLYNLFGSASTSSEWTWARMKPGQSVKRGAEATGVNNNNPLYSIRYTIPSVLKNSAGVVVSGTKVSTTQCHFYYNKPAPVTSTCFDYDNGKDFYKAGYVELSDKNFGNNGRKEDVCASDGKTLTEYSCTNSTTYGGSTSFTCPNGCSNGACKSVSTTGGVDMGSEIRACEQEKDFVQSSANEICRGIIIGTGTEEFKLRGDGVIVSERQSLGCQNINWKETNPVWKTKQCTPNTSTVSCTGTRPANSIILVNVGTTSRAWTYDGSTTGPYQNCTFKCQTDYSYSNSTCVANTTTVICPLYPVPDCTNGTLVDGGKDANGCSLGLKCESNVTCPQLSPPPADFCKDGQIIDGGTNANGCQLPPTCGPKIITGAVTIDSPKDCWFGDVTRRITLNDFLSYQATPGANSGLKYLDEILFYGASVPTATTSLSNILSYEDAVWTAADGSTPTMTTQLTNFFVLRTNSNGTRTWNMPTGGVKFYGCFARGDRPNTW